MKPGIYYNMPAAQYHSIEAVSDSLLSRLSISPLHALGQLANYADNAEDEDPSISMASGSLAHTLILEPEKFDQLYEVGPCEDRRLKAWKDAAAMGDGLRTMIKPSELHAVQAMAAAVYEHETARGLLAELPKREVSIFWIDEKTGLLCKCRPDIFAEGSDLFVDIKTVSRVGGARPHVFQKTISDFGYHRKAAWYMRGIGAATGEKPKHAIFIVLEQKGVVTEFGLKHACACYNLIPEALAIGRGQCDRLLQQFAELPKDRESSAWKAYGDGLTDIGLPSWDWKQNEDLIDETNAE